MKLLLQAATIITITRQGCSDGNNTNSQNKNANATNSSPNSTSPITDGITLTK